jgi:hypothetical protein
MRVLALPSKSFPIRISLFIIPFNKKYFQYGERNEINHLKAEREKSASLSLRESRPFDLYFIRLLYELEPRT